ncbi:DmsC/YnfH family molybdoenzyme membrane anchor subunit [Thiomonas sp.]|uniref:dimethyl sulfoxide reductase anchor subunit family protein n=1 Tax=Thiomonas sp. TaxID=2047785 RepID=UPI0026240C84|nr:DmsC/YnfH family molybdoenzyme membrane anchor subunit [Thiomonas sp.]
MRPAFSVLLLTTLIGCAQGLAVALAVPLLAGAGAQAGWLDFWRLGLGCVLVLGAAGLMASFAHLGRPERAWRAAAMWRTSWLSREVIVLPGFLGIAALSLLSLLMWQRWPLALAALLVAAALVLWLCTAMIYASVRFLREWATPLTLVNFLLMGLASGGVLAACLALWRLPLQAGHYAQAAAAALVAALLGRSAAAWRVRRLEPAGSLQTAIGVASPAIRQISRGFTAAAFTTQEFFHGRTAVWVAAMRSGWVVLGFILPLTLLLLVPAPWRTVAWPVALVGHLLGLLAERWEFFAQVRHPQNRYVQAAL